MRRGRDDSFPRSTPGHDSRRTLRRACADVRRLYTSSASYDGQSARSIRTAAAYHYHPDMLSLTNKFGAFRYADMPMTPPELTHPSAHPSTYPATHILPAARPRGHTPHIPIYPRLGHCHPRFCTHAHARPHPPRHCYAIYSCRIPCIA
ncbi:hypothetical protein C2E23DRAFT_18637 [Lenzites betulinus]|nr:hypothetical protein C2E23DRAFT_18637 [Lenzites betulinus]